MSAQYRFSKFQAVGAQQRRELGKDLIQAACVSLQNAVGFRTLSVCTSELRVHRSRRSRCVPFAATSARFYALCRVCSSGCIELVAFTNLQY